ncbi:MAG: hypothetical protein O3C21_10030, partial [Verrucomicrobia bacterium]|nr:hypothetical protein [Verrucomicrobiota bacterium]
MKILSYSYSKAPLFLLALIIIAFALLPKSALGSSATPPVNTTGAPGHSSCTQCHSGGRGTGNVALVFSGGAVYEPGQKYTLQVAITEANQRRFGFSMVARDSDNDRVNVGAWSPGGNDTQVHGSQNSIASHRNAPTGNGSHTFTVNWTAPANGVGDVTFYVAGNAANSNNSSSGDSIYLKQVIIGQAAPPNQAPSLTVPEGPLEFAEGTSAAITGIAVADPDSAGGNLSVAMSVANGILNIADTVAGGVGVAAITDNGSASVSLTGTLAELNATFADPNGIIYLSNPGFQGDDILEIVANDNGNNGGEAQFGSATVEIAVTAAPNQPPSVTVPDGPLTATVEVPTSIEGIVLVDSDSGEGSLTVVVSVANGILNIADTVAGGVGVAAITDNGSATVSLTGTLAELNATFADPNGVIYLSNPGFQGEDSLQLAATDSAAGIGNATVTLLVNPAPMPSSTASISGLVFSGTEGIRFTLTGDPGTSFIVEHSEDFEAWTL